MGEMETQTSTSEEMNIQRKNASMINNILLHIFSKRKRNYDMRSAHPGNQEQVIIDNPLPGTYYIVLYGFDRYNSVGFEAEYR